MKYDMTNIDTIAARLRQTETNFDDDSFTAAVVTQLPGSSRLSTWQRNAILLTATALGSSIGAWQLPRGAILELLNTAATDIPALLGTAAIITYSAAFAALWTANRY